jgi:hypothetical protein
MERAELNRAHKADIHYMHGDRASMGRWLDSSCKHPYIVVCLTTSGNVSMLLTVRQPGDAGPSKFWDDRSMCDQHVCDGTYNGLPATNENWLVGIAKNDVPRTWYVVFDDPGDANAFKAQFREADQS